MQNEMRYVVLEQTATSRAVVCGNWRILEHARNDAIELANVARATGWAVSGDADAGYLFTAPDGGGSNRVITIEHRDAAAQALAKVREASYFAREGMLRTGRTSQGVWLKEAVEMAQTQGCADADIKVALDAGAADAQAVKS